MNGILAIGTAILAVAGTTGLTGAQAQGSGSAPRAIWSFAITGSPNGDAVVTAVDTYPSGASTIGGSFRNPVTVPTSPPSNLTPQGELDGFVGKVAPEGSVAWTSPIKTPSGSIYVRAVGASPDDGVIAAGYVGESRQATFGSGTDAVTISSDGQMMFVAKYDSTGRLSWVRHSQSAPRTGMSVLGMDLDASGTIYVTGSVRGANTISAGSSSRTIGTDFDQAYFAKFSPTGDLLLADVVSKSPEPYSSLGYGIAAREDGSFVLAGDVVVAPAVLGDGNRSFSVDNDGLFVASYNPDGSLAWGQGTYSSNDGVARPRAVTITGDNSIVVAGSLSRTVNFGSDSRPVEASSSYGMFVASYSAAGAASWARAFTTPETAWVSGLAPGRDGSALIAGYFQDALSFEFPTDISALSARIAAGYVLSFSRNGQLQSAIQTTGNWTSDIAAIGAWPNGDFVVGGRFYYSVSFGDDAPSTTLTSGAFANGLVARYEAPRISAPSAPVITQVAAGDGRLAVNWSRPDSDGGSPVTSYQAQATPGSNSCTTSTALRCTITGLTNGNTYTVTVTAINQAGESVPSSGVTGIPVATPRPPAKVTSLRLRSLKGAVQVTWSSPPGSGSFTYEYRVGKTAWRPTPSTTVRIPGKSGVTIAVQVRAVNGFGPGATATVRGAPR